MKILSAIEGGLGFSMGEQLPDARFLGGAGSWDACGTESLSARRGLWLHGSVAVLPVGGVLILSSTGLDLSPFARCGVLKPIWGSRLCLSESRLRGIETCRVHRSVNAARRAQRAPRA